MEIRLLRLPALVGEGLGGHGALPTAHRPSGGIRRGREFAEAWQTANVYVEATSEDTDDPSGAESRVAAVWHSMWLHGILRVERVDGVYGEVADGARQICGRIDDFAYPIRLGGVDGWPNLDADILASVDNVAAGIIARNKRPDEFRRLWHGLRALLRGLRDGGDNDAIERSANLVRSLEVLVFGATEKRAGAPQFGERAACFMTDGNAALLQDAYKQLRNTGVHMHERHLYVKDTVKLPQILELGRFIDLLAPHVWREVLGSPQRMETMSDANLSSFQAHLIEEAAKKDPTARSFARWTGARFTLLPKGTMPDGAM